MLPLTRPCALGEEAWIVADCAAHPLTGLGPARLPFRVLDQWS